MVGCSLDADRCAKARGYYEDNVTVGVDAVVYFRVINAPKAVLETTNYIYATSQFAQAALRDVTGNIDMDDLLAKREELSQQIKEMSMLKLTVGD